MFNNKFNSSKKDPLVEAVETAMKDGNLRREAERLVNEHFGVFSRKAVIRENLAAYDAALEEAYKCMKEDEKWEGSKEDTDEDKKLAKKHGMTLAQWEKSAADKKHDKHEKNEKKKHGKDIDEGLDPVGKEDDDVDNDGDKDKSDKYLLNRRKTIGRAMGKRMEEAKKSWEEEVDYSAQDRAPVTKSAPKEDPSTPKSYPGAASSLTAGNPTSQRMSNAKAAVSPIKEGQADPTGNAVTAPKEWAMKAKTPNKNAVTKAPVPGVSIVEDEQVDEAAYSAKAGAAGKDLGKPGKQFSKIAAKAGKKYGSKERGKAVAGAILKRIRAKHMEEQTQIDEIVTKDALAKSGLSLRDYMNRDKGLTRRDAPSAKPSSSPQGAVGLKGPTGDAFSKTATQPGSQRWADPGKRDYSASNQGTVKPAAPAPAPENKPAWHAPMARPPQEIASKVQDVNTGAPKVAQGAPMPTVTASAPKNKEAGALPKTMAESVQVGTAKYKIV